MSKFLSNFFKFLVFACFVLYTVAIIYPLLWMVISSIKTNKEFFTDPWGFAAVPQWIHYAQAWKSGIANYFLNSVFVTVATVFFSIFVSAMAAYIVSRFDFKTKNLAFYIVMGGLMVSPEVNLVALFKLLQSLHIYNTLWGLIVPYVAFRIPFTVFLMRSYFLSVPKEIEESAFIDGCSPFRVFASIVMPISKPIVASASLLAAMGAWNEFMFALIFIESDKNKTIPIGLLNLRGQFSTNYPRLVAALLMSAVVMIVVFLIFQKSFVRGLTQGGVKG